MELAGRDVRELYNIPMGDKAAYKLLNDQKYSGIFQFNGSTMISVAKETDIRELEDIAVLIAISRPGPMVSGNAEKWIAYRKIDKKVDMPDMLRPMLDHTYGIPIYQEQVMRIGWEIGGLSWGDVTALRQAMSKSLGREYFDKYGDPWKKGALSRRAWIRIMLKSYGTICAFMDRSVSNKSHCVAYGLISYWCAYIKARYPVPFAAATLSYEDDVERQRIILREILAEGITYLPFDAELSREALGGGRETSDWAFDECPGDWA